MILEFLHFQKFGTIQYISDCFLTQDVVVSLFIENLRYIENNPQKLRLSKCEISSYSTKHQPGKSLNLDHKMRVLEQRI